MQPEDGPKIKLLQSEHTYKDEHMVDTDEQYLTNPLLGHVLLTPLEKKVE